MSNYTETVEWMISYIAVNGLVFDKELAGELLERWMRDNWIAIQGFGDD